MQTPFAIFLLALLVRLLWIAVVHNDSLIGDAGWYHARAVSLTSGQGYSIQGTPTAYFPPRLCVLPRASLRPRGAAGVGGQALQCPSRRMYRVAGVGLRGGHLRRPLR